MAQGELGRCLTKLTRFEVAEPMLLKSYEFGQANFGDSHVRALERCQYLAELYDAWSKPEQAAEWRATSVQPMKGGADSVTPSAPEEPATRRARDPR
ncbi:MAG: tetratricopeptide repeat protein [Planctomycetes bacterium]|nr:tetratricopeptide repeat protein [Planctomycetota bacterium]